MIGKVLRGVRVQGLVRYLYGPGRNGEHRDPHIVAGFAVTRDLEPVRRPDGSRDFRRLDGLLTQPLALLGDRNYRKPVWHLPVRAAPEDPILSDQQWAQVADEIMDRTGLAPDGDADAVRWIAVRHADDHIHIVATLARADGIRPEVWNDGYRVRDACRAVERRFGLRPTAPADRTAARRPQRAETEKASRHGRAETPRSTLRRHVQTAAAGARTEDEFFARLRTEDVLVRQRFSQHSPGEVTGYAIALDNDRNADGEPVWFGGGKLAADLTLPKLRHRWSGTGPHSVRRQTISGRHLSAQTVRAFLRTTVRHVADQSRTADEFFNGLEQAGLLVRQRFSIQDPGHVTGYAVAMPDHFGPDRQNIWYAGGRLAPDLTWTRLSEHWRTGGSNPAPHPSLTSEERQAFYNDAASAAARATAEIRRCAVTNPYRARDACWAAADTLRAAAQATNNRHLHRAADAYDRAARPPHGQIPTPTPVGNTLRTTARLLALTDPGDRTSTASRHLARALALLLDAIVHLHAAQWRTPQTAAATKARDCLTPAITEPSDFFRRAPEPDHAAVNVAMASFPNSWAPDLRSARKGRQRGRMSSNERTQQRSPQL